MEPKARGAPGGGRGFSVASRARDVFLVRRARDVYVVCRDRDVNVESTSIRTLRLSELGYHFYTFQSLNNNDNDLCYGGHDVAQWSSSQDDEMSYFVTVVAIVVDVFTSCKKTKKMSLMIRGLKPQRQIVSSS